MKTKIAIITLTAIISLIGCAGQYDDDPQDKLDKASQKMIGMDMSPINIREYNVEQNPTVVLLGDSRVDGFNTFVIGSYWPTRHIVNMGLMSTGSYYSVRASEIVKNYNPEIVIISCGGNNAYRNILDSYKTDLQVMIANIKKDCPTTKIYISKIVSLSLIGTLLDPAVNMRIGYLNSVIDSLSSEENVYVIDPKSTMENQHGLLKDEFTTDGTHFSKAGYDALVAFYEGLIF